MKHNGTVPDARAKGGDSGGLSREELGILFNQGGNSVFRVELDSGVAVRFLTDGTSAPLNNVFPQCLTESGSMPEESAEQLTRLWQSACRREPSVSCEVLMNTAEGKQRWFVVEYNLLSNSDGRTTHALFSLRDETGLHERELAYEKWRESLLTMFAENASYAEFNLTRGVLERQTGMPSESAGARPNCTISEFVDYACEYMIYEEDGEDYREFFDRQRLLSLFERNVSEDTLEYRDCTSGVQWMRASVQMTRYPGSTDVKAFIVYTNIDHQRSELERLARLASRDSLTNILNRKAMEDRITERLSSAAEDELSALYIIDLDNFKQINDRFGHQAGDETLKNVAAALNNTFRSSDIVGRLGGDEFMAFISGVTERNAIARANRLINELQFLVENASLSASVGLALCVGKAEFSAMYRGADKALYRSKDMGKNRCTVYRHGEEQVLNEDSAGEANVSGMIQLQTLLEYMDGGVIIVDIQNDDFDVIYTSPSYYTTMRRTPEEVGKHGEQLFDSVLAEDRPMLIDAMLKTAQFGQPTDTIYRVDSSGATEWHHLRAVRLPGTTGGTKVIGVITDVSELKKSSSRFEAIAAYSTVGIAMFDLSESGARATFVNPKLQSMIGLTAEQINDNPKTVSLLTGGQEMRHRGIGHIAAGSEDNTFEFICRGSDVAELSGELYLQACGVHIYDSAQSCVVLVMYVDITRERAMEEQLRMVEKRYRIAAAQTGMFIWEADIASRSVRVFGNSIDDHAEGSDYSNAPGSLLETGHIHPDSEQVLKVMFSDIYAGRESDEYVLRRRDRNGAYVWARARYTLVRDADGVARHAVGVSEVMPNIDAELRELRRTWQFSGLIEDILRGTFHINLTRDVVDYVHVREMSREDQDRVASFEDCKELFRMIMAKDEANEVTLRTITSEWLMELYRQGHRTHMFEFRTETGEGSGWNSLIIDLLRDPLSGDIWAFFYLRDVSNKKVNEALLDGMPDYDTVTQLYNYSTVREAIRIYAAAAEAKSRLVISVLDLTGMTELMRSQGMAEASRVLRLVGRLLRILLGDSAIFGHLTQSRFIVMHSEVRSLDSWRGEMQQLLERANDLLRKSEVSEAVRLMCGYVSAQAGSADCGVLIRQASIACRAAFHADLGMAVYSEAEFGSLPDDTDAAEVDNDNSPEMAALSKKYRALELSYQQLINRYREHERTGGLSSHESFCRTVNELLDSGGEEYVMVACEIDRAAAFCSVYGAHECDELVTRMVLQLNGKAITATRAENYGFMFFALREGFDAGSVHASLKKMLEPFAENMGLDVRMSVCAVPEEKLSVTEICERTAAVLHMTGKGQLVISDAELYGSMPDAQSAVNELVAALSEEQIVLRLRPQFDCVGGRIAGIDAVALWEHPHMGTLMPEDFLSRFERSGMDGRLSEYIIERGCRFMRSWLEAFGYNVPLHLSEGEACVRMLQPGFSKMLDRMTQRYGIDNNMLRLEFREQTYLEKRQKLGVAVEKLRRKGFRVGLEDFGSGHSSLDAMLDIPFDSLKLNERLLHRCLEGKRGRCILSSLIDSSHRMEFETVASGVSSREEAGILREMGCTRMQGELFSELLTAEEIIACNHQLPRTAPLQSENEIYWQTVAGSLAALEDSGRISQFMEDVCSGRMCGVAVAAAEENSAIEYANREACRIFACKDLPSFACDEGLSALALQDDRDYFCHCISQAAGGEEPVYFECRAKDAVGQIIWIKGVLKSVAFGSRRVVMCEFLDVTDRHSEEQEQLLSSYSEALMTCFNEICELNFENQTITVRYSSYGNRMLGVACPLWDTVQKLCRTHIVPEDAHKLPEFIERISRTGVNERNVLEYELRGRDGRVHAIYSRAVHINSTRCLLCNTDVTETKQLAIDRQHDLLKAGLRRERENYYSMVERLGSTVVEWDLTDGTCWSSDSCSRYAMNSVGDQATGVMMGSGVHSEDMVKFAVFMSRLESSENYADATLRMRMSDGSYRWTMLSGETIRDASGLPVRILVSLTDVDEEMRSRQEIADYTARSMAFIENIPGGVLLVNIKADGISGSANECFCRFIGYSSLQLKHTLHERWSDIVTPGDRRWIEREIRHLVVGENNQIDVICSLRHREGYDVPVRVLAALIDRGEDSISLAFICVDEQTET